MPASGASAMQYFWPDLTTCVNTSDKDYLDQHILCFFQEALTQKQDSTLGQPEIRQAPTSSSACQQKSVKGIAPSCSLVSKTILLSLQEVGRAFFSGQLQKLISSKKGSTPTDIFVYYCS